MAFLLLLAERTQLRCRCCGSFSSINIASICPLCTFQTGITVGVVFAFSNVRVDSCAALGALKVSAKVNAVASAVFIAMIVDLLCLEGKAMNWFLNAVVGCQDGQPLARIGLSFVRH